MPSLPLLRPRDVVRAFEQKGWQIARQRGSHIVMTKPTYVARGTLRALISKAGLTTEGFLEGIR
jgi:predicted RNA binding protein YcfA (HicA-like mRNA interferase family)